ncbi:site-specific DNA-methyltransferase [Azospirillum brasilense]|uniref:site-specific DNA-methyltransferase (adenine-specific) n=1 Tax=Azospirillum brasilense TaxID=192 RepID=A0A4D8R7L3_AZOBR|nr:site-specific DNA-methyltransferase [Azospirillum brasilense]QCO15339.1 site-specific DNA-methyltransferase [Azospirillum brasilense]
MAEKEIGAIRHKDAKRRLIPTAELQSVMDEAEKAPVRVAYERRNRDLDPQLVWRGKDEQDWSDLIVQAPPLYIQEKVHPKVLIEELKRETRARAEGRKPKGSNYEMFADFNGLPDKDVATEFYRHDSNWTNRIVLGDSLSVMASLAEREGLRGKVQCIYFDPPYGIRFNSNFQWSTTSRDVKDGNKDHITREPEQVRAFRDTWRDGIHSYLTYLRDRLTVARDLLADSGSIFVQIGDENVHRVRALLEEVFGEDNFISEILVKKKGSQKSSGLDPVNDYILWFSKSSRSSGVLKIRSLFEAREIDAETIDEFSRVEMPNGNAYNLKSYVDKSGGKLDFRAFPKRVFEEFPGGRLFRPWPITNGGERPAQMDPVVYNGEPIYPPKGNCWRHTSRPGDEGLPGMERNKIAGRIIKSKTSLDYKRYLDDFPYKSISNWWDGFGGAADQIYVVQTNERLIERCILMATDPGDIVLDPTCGSGTTAYVAEQWGRRWITIDTSRVALALARARIMGARYPYYLLADSREGQIKEGEVTRTPPKDAATRGDIRQGFVYRRHAYITSGVIANNAEIDVIWEGAQKRLEPLRAQLNATLGTGWEEWEIPRLAEENWPKAAKALHAEWWALRIQRQKDIDASISAKAEFEYLYDKPYVDNGKVRVAGPFTVESLSPHRILAMDQDDELIDLLDAAEGKRKASDLAPDDFAAMILDNLRAAGVQQAHKEDRIAFTSLTPWPGDFIAAEGRYMEGERERRAGILIGPEFGTVSRADLVAAAREAGDAGFDVVVACAFNYDARSADFEKLGRIPVLKARMNPDLHMGGDLKTTGTGNLFVVFGEPDIDILKDADGRLRVRIKGIDVFHPSTGEITSGGPDTIAVWFIDTDYNEESFFVRHAYFLGASDPYKALRTTLKAEIDADAWASLNSDTSRPFDLPTSGRIAVKVINHLGDEVMKVFSVE